MKKLMIGVVAACAAMGAWALEPAPQPPAVQAQLAAEFAKAKMVTTDLKPYERALTLTAYVPDDNLVWKCGDKPEAVFELRDAEGRLVTGEGLKGLWLFLETYATHEKTNERLEFDKIGNPFRRTMTRTEPGVVALTASLYGGERKEDGTIGKVIRGIQCVKVDEKGNRRANGIVARVGALFDPLKIRSGKPDPEGFDAKWKQFLDEDKKCSNTPKYYEVRPSSTNNPVHVYAGVLDSPAGDVHFDWGVPKAAREGKKKMPIRVFLQAYMTGFHFAEAWIGDQLTLGINCHSCSNKASGAYWKAEGAKHPNFGFSTNENAKVETCYHVNMLRRDIRALNWAMSQPEWDGTNVFVHGDSQGGFQTFALAGLFPQINRAWSMCPWYIDVGGSQQHWRPLWQPGPDFADPVHHIARTHAKKVKYTFGIADSAGPADGMMALFNNLPESVEFAEITIVQNRGHDAGHESRGVFPCYVFTRENGKISGQYYKPGPVTFNPKAKGW